MNLLRTPWPVAPWLQRRRNFWLGWLLTALGYWGLAQVTIHFFAPQGQASLFFVASGWALAAVLLGGPRYIGAVALGALLYGLGLEQPLSGLLLPAVGSALSAGVAATLLRRSRDFDARLLTLRDYAQLLLWGALVAPLLSASVGSTALMSKGLVAPGQWLDTALTWWMGDALGVLLLTPVLLIGWAHRQRPLTRANWAFWLEAGLFMGWMCVVAAHIFVGLGNDWLASRPHLLPASIAKAYWMFPYIALIAVRLGLRSTGISLLLVAGISVVGTNQGLGFFGLDGEQRLTSYWFFTVCLNLVGMTLAFYIESNQKLAAALSQRADDASQELSRVMTALNRHALVAVIDTEGGILSANANFCRVTGYSQDELRAGDRRLLRTQLHDKAYYRQIYDTLQQGQVWHGEISRRARDGRVFWLLQTLAPIYGDSHQPTQYVAIAADISERKAADQELARYRQSLEQLVEQRTTHWQNALSVLTATLEAADQGILVISNTGEVALWNQLFLSLWGLSPETVAKRDAHYVRTFMARQVHDPEAYLAGIARLLAQPAQSSRDSVQLLDGRTLRRTVHPQLIDGVQVGRVWSYVDITEIKQTEAAAQAANRAKSEFLANMSHEIRTPMNGVVGMLDVVLQSPLQSRQRRDLEIARQSALALLTILNDLLDHAKIEAGKMTVEHIATPLGQVCESVLQLLLPRAAQRGIDLSLQVAPDVPAWVLSDPTRLRQVLFNLLGNAVKFTTSTAQQPGQVSLQVRPVPADNGHTLLQLCVSDNGIGMTQEVLANLFTPFTQAEAGTARQFGGTGLGLAICQHLVTLMGGQIRVQSQPGKGSVFTVLLPLQAALAPEQPNLPPAPEAQLPGPQAAGQLILLAEDNETNRDVMAEQLRLLGYSADIAADGQQALALWRSGRHALLLTDLHMPLMDGLALTRAIRAAEAPGQRLPIIAVSANAMQGEAQRCFEAGIDDFLTKPLRVQALARMLAQWLPRSTAALPPPGLPEAAPGGLLSWDAGALSQLVGHNPSVHQRLLDKFLLLARPQVAELAAACNHAEPDWPAAAELAHALKSSARAVGALALGECCQQLEQAAQAGELASCQALCADVPGLFAQAQDLIQVHLTDLAQKLP